MTNPVDGCSLVDTMKTWGAGAQRKVNRQPRRRQLEINNTEAYHRPLFLPPRVLRAEKAFENKSPNHTKMSGKFEPKVPVNLDPPKDDPISLEELSKAKGALPLHFHDSSREMPLQPRRITAKSCGFLCMFENGGIGTMKMSVAVPGPPVNVLLCGRSRPVAQPKPLFFRYRTKG